MASQGGTSRTNIGRKPERASYDRDVVNAILDAAPICHVGLVREGLPVVIPTIHARDGDVIYLHGSPAAGMLRPSRRQPEQMCITVTIIDGVVLSRSARNHSLNYRSAVVFGRARTLSDIDLKARALRLVVDHVAPGRWGTLRPMTEREVRETEVVVVTIEEASAKARSGGPLDGEADRRLPIWAGVLPLGLTGGIPAPDPEVPAGTTVPDHVLALADRWTIPGTAFPGPS
ncbi:MAG: pyridoxamine 5'-phosphate oxidase family protein [Acidimicrobiales bacterium]